MAISVDPALCIPVLASLDLAETKRFYIGHLGFPDCIYEDADYLILRRDSMELHFWRTDNRIHPENTSCYIRGGQIIALHAEFRARAIPRLSALEHKPWDMLEFHLHDPHGNLLRFGCVPEGVAS